MDETKTLAHYVVASRLEDIPQDVHKESLRALLNYVGCALGGANHEALTIAMDALATFSGPPIARVLGRKERLDPLTAAVMNGIASHVHDFDDTTPQNYIHPSPPVASALFAYASANRVRGEDFLHAFVLGFEVESRVGNAVFPAHYDAGWHITGTAGVIGAAAAIGRLLGLTHEQMVWAIGLAVTQASGMREMFGSMGKPYHAGHAARNGIVAALLAQKGFTAGARSLEGPRGFAAVSAARYDLAKMTAKLGEDFNLRVNTYKPYACGIVIHPAIDGCSQLRERHSIAAETVTAVRLRVAPLVMDLCSKKDIARGLEGKYSIYHGAALGLVRGKAGLAEFTDEAVSDPAITRVRERVGVVVDPAITEDQVDIEVDLADGRTLHLFVAQSLGNIHRPMSDRQLEDKFRDQAAASCPAVDAGRAIELCWKIDRLDDIGELIDALCP